MRFDTKSEATAYIAENNLVGVSACLWVDEYTHANHPSTTGWYIVKKYGHR